MQRAVLHCQREQSNGPSGCVVRQFDALWSQHAYARLCRVLPIFTLLEVKLAEQDANRGGIRKKCAEP